MFRFLLFFYGFLMFMEPVPAQEKLRVIVLTDIENEPDDAMSLVRFLLYSNQWDVEGIIATTSVWQRDKVASWRIREILYAYGQVVSQLLLHENGYPSEEFFLSVTKDGLPEWGMEGVGPGKDSEGSNWLLHCIQKNDDRPLWVLAWGGTNCLAQSLWKLQSTRSREELADIEKKLRVYTISDQDDSGPWIRKNFPGLFYMVSPGRAEGNRDGYFYATWSGISGEQHYQFKSGADTSLVQNRWVDKNIQHNHGPLGEQYPDIAYIMEGDSPSFMYLIENGLNVPEHPEYGGWGGRYEYYLPRTQPWFYSDETRPIWTDASDKVRGMDDYYYYDNHATIWRWREAYQNDFAARMDWCISGYKNANHPPVPVLDQPTEIKTKSGQQVSISAKGSHDPDGDLLSFNWLYYKEAGTYDAILPVPDPASPELTFTAPPVSVPVTVHLILEVTDDGKPCLTRYKRVIIEIMPP